MALPLDKRKISAYGTAKARHPESHHNASFPLIPSSIIRAKAKTTEEQTNQTIGPKGMILWRKSYTAMTTQADNADKTGRTIRRRQILAKAAKKGGAVIPSPGGYSKEFFSAAYAKFGLRLIV